jgi:hypothetical protein
MPSHTSALVVPVTVPGLQRMKREGTRIVSLTAYDFSFARLMDRAGVDILLVGDSLGMVIQGHANTLPVTLSQMIYHASAVVRGVQRAMVVCDLPFGVCHGGGKRVMDAAVRVLKESGCQAVKLEGGVRMAKSIRYLVQHEVPVMGHVGLTPQAVHRMRLRCRRRGRLRWYWRGFRRPWRSRSLVIYRYRPLVLVLEWRVMGRYWYCMICWGYMARWCRDLPSVIWRMGRYRRL